MEVKENQDSDVIFLELNGAVHNKRVEVSPKMEMVYFPNKVDCVFGMWSS